MLIILITLPMFVMGLRSTKLAEEKMLEQYLASMQEINKSYYNLPRKRTRRKCEIASITCGNFNLRNILVDPTTEPYLVDAIAAYRDVNPNVLNSFVGTREKKMYISPYIELPADYDPTTRG